MGLPRRAFLGLATRLAALVALPLLSLGSLGPLGCGGDEEADSGPRVYVGTVDQSELRVGLVVEGGKAALFFCGGPATLPLTRWFRGAAEGDRLSLSKEGALANGTFDAERAAGTLQTASGETLSWHLARVPDGSVAGLYEAKDDGIAGVVVMSEDFAQGAYIGPAPAFLVFQIIVIRPVKPNVDGLSVSVGPREIVVTRVRPK